MLPNKSDLYFWAPCAHYILMQWDFNDQPIILTALSRTNVPLNWECHLLYFLSQSENISLCLGNTVLLSGWHCSICLFSPNVCCVLLYRSMNFPQQRHYSVNQNHLIFGIWLWLRLQLRLFCEIFLLQSSIYDHLDANYYINVSIRLTNHRNFYMSKLVYFSCLHVIFFRLLFYYIMFCNFEIHPSTSLLLV